MSRVTKAVEWKNELITHRYKLKRYLAKMQNERIKGLEEMVTHLTEAYHSLTALSEKVMHETNAAGGLRKSFVMDSSFSRVKIARPLHITGQTQVPQRRQKRAQTIVHRKGSMGLGLGESSTHIHTESPVPGLVEVADHPSFAWGRHRHLENHLHVQKMQNAQLRMQLEEARVEAARNKDMLDKAQRRQEEELQIESRKWEDGLDEYKALTDLEMEKKELQLLKMNEVLSSWIHRYMQLQEERGHHRRTLSSVPESSSLDLKQLCKLTTDVLLACKDQLLCRSSISPAMTGKSTTCRSGLITPAVFEID